MSLHQDHGGSDPIPWAVSYRYVVAAPGELRSKKKYCHVFLSMPGCPHHGHTGSSALQPIIPSAKNRGLVHHALSPAPPRIPGRHGVDALMLVLVLAPVGAGASPPPYQTPESY